MHITVSQSINHGTSSQVYIGSLKGTVLQSILWIHVFRLVPQNVLKHFNVTSAVTHMMVHRGDCVIVYLDDFLMIEDDYAQCLAAHKE